MIEKEENKTTETEEQAENAVVAEETSDEIEEPEKNYDIVGVRFKPAGKIYYFDPQGLQLSAGSHAIVETARGIEYGLVAIGNRTVTETQLMETISTREDKDKDKKDKTPTVPQLRPVIREATEEDDAIYEENKRKQEEAKRICLEKIAEHKLEMKLLDAEYTFDNSKLFFYFTAEGRVDFRELVKSLAAIFKTRIDLRQVGIRDETKIIGGLGVCGRPFCCKKFLEDFVQVSIKMAKEQNLSLNSQKISGACGRLMCCLRYEQEAYEDELAKMPKMEALVETPDGRGIVCELSPLTGLVKVRFPEEHQMIRVYVKDQIKVIASTKKEQKALRDAETKTDN
ncbi:MAG: stage 0 sporulation family protein [Clostridia bacterium]|nr:stage 0 sporulation family protein [Clostridia bacterium]